MKIIHINTFPKNVPLCAVDFGTVVRRVVSGDTAYLVVSSMDGTGRRALVSLKAGTLRDMVDQESLVIPLNAELHVLGDAS